MALVNLKNVKVYATFKSGFRVVEESTGKNGETYKQRWTVWADAEVSGRIREGDVVSLSGFLSAKVNEWTDKDGQVKHSVELSLNSPRMGDAPVQQPPADTWTGPAVDTFNDQEVPF